MRVLRAKQIRKYLKFYKLIFEIDPPYHIILDGNFLYHVMKYKLDIKIRLQKLLQDNEIILYITRSSINELNSVGNKAKSALEFASTCCTIIEDDSFTGETAGEKLIEYLRSSINNTRRRYYFVASQDKELRSTIAHSIAGIPLIYLNQVTLVLEPPSELSKRGQIQNENSKTIVSEMEKEILNQLRETSETPEEQANHERKKRRALAPNPLSHKKASENSHTTKKKKIEKYSRGSHAR